MMASMIWPLAKFCVNHLHGQSNVSKSKVNKAAFVICRSYAPFKKSNPAPTSFTALKNNQIRYPVMRVVYKDKDTGENVHKILLREDALELALLYELDLVLGNVNHVRQYLFDFFHVFDRCNDTFLIPTLLVVRAVNESSDPPIARLEDFGKMMQKKNVKLKEIRVNQKARAVKEMSVGGGIDKHDLGIKMKKVIEFLAEGHPVRVFVTAKKHRLKTDPYCVEETTMKVLELVEDYVASVQQPENYSSMRKDFILNPKPKSEQQNAPKSASAAPKAPIVKIENDVNSEEQYPENEKVI